MQQNRVKNYILWFISMILLFLFFTLDFIPYIIHVLSCFLKNSENVSRETLQKHFWNTISRFFCLCARISVFGIRILITSSSEPKKWTIVWIYTPVFVFFTFTNLRSGRESQLCRTLRGALHLIMFHVKHSRSYFGTFFSFLFLTM